MDRKCIKLRMNIEYPSINLVQKLLDTQMFICKMKYLNAQIYAIWYIRASTWIIRYIICVEPHFYNVLNYDSFVWTSKTSEIFFTYMVLLYSIFNWPHPMTNVSYLYNLHMLQSILTFLPCISPTSLQKGKCSIYIWKYQTLIYINPTNIYSEFFLLS